MTKEELYQFYIKENHSFNDTASFFNIGSKKLRKILNDFNIHKRHKKEKYPSKELMENLYIEQKMSMIEIGKKLNYSSRTIPIILKHYNIPLLSQQENCKKARETYKKKTGFDSPLQNPNVLEKIKQTTIKKYGIDKPQKTQEYKEKMKKFFVSKKGKEILEKSKNKREKTNLEKYGAKFVIQNEKIKNKMIETSINKYGVSNFNQKHYSKETYKILKNKDSLEKWLLEHPNLPFSTIIDMLNVSYSSIQQRVKKWGLQHLVDFGPEISQEEKQIHKLFIDAKIPFIANTRDIIPPKELDLYFPDYNFAIEFNGNYYHSEEGNIGYTYHQRKSLDCEQKNIFLFHIFEYEWADKKTKKKIVNFIRNIFGKKQIIKAEECQIGFPSEEDKKTFLESYCFDEDKSTFEYGLYYKEELIMLMTLRKHKKFYEILNILTKPGLFIEKGENKLFNQFTKDYHPHIIVSYVNCAKNDGKIFDSLGFEIDRLTKPHYVWWNNYTEDIIKETDKSDEEMQELHYHKIYDAGYKKMIYYNNSVTY